MHFIYKALILHWHARCLPGSTAVRQLNFIELSDVIPGGCWHIVRPRSGFFVYDLPFQYNYP